MDIIKFNGHSTGAPTGSIMSYMGTSDPGGFVICDGILRNNGQDGRYNKLIAANIGSGTIYLNYTPPNLTNLFLRGSSTITNINKLGGSASVKLTSNELPKHNHKITDNGHIHAIPDKQHTHGITDNGHNHSTTTYWKSSSVMQNNGDWASIGENWGQNGNTYTEKNTCGLTQSNKKSGITSTNNNTTTISLGTTGNGKEFPILPQHVTVNYIIKL